MSELERLVEQSDFSIPNRGYWYLRTDGGSYYDEYKNEGYVAINYNYVPLNTIRNNNTEHLSRLITDNDPKFDNVQYDDLPRGMKSTVSKYIGIIQKFNGMSNGDVIVIPSSDSQTFCIGIISDSRIYKASEEELEECDYLLRRKVDWQRKDVFLPPYSPIRYSLKHSHLALTKIEKHSEYLNGALKPFFLQDNKYYLTIDVKRDEDIPLNDLRNLLDSYYNIIKILNEAYDYQEDITEAIVKLNLNSKGIINLIQEKKNNSTKSLVAAAILLSLLTPSCGKTEIQERTGLNEERSEKLEIEVNRLNESRENLRINRREI